jgi:hypothetical protein
MQYCYVMGVHLCDEVQLLHVVLAREERLAAQQLSHDARHRPASAAVHTGAGHDSVACVRSAQNCMQGSVVSACFVRRSQVWGRNGWYCG